jgi:hypothetical protein
MTQRWTSREAPLGSSRMSQSSRPPRMCSRRRSGWWGSRSGRTQLSRASSLVMVFQFLAVQIMPVFLPPSGFSKKALVSLDSRTPAGSQA